MYFLPTLSYRCGAVALWRCGAAPLQARDRHDGDGRKTTQCWGGAQMTAQDEGDRRPTGYYWVGCPMRKDLPDPQGIGKMAAERTLDLLGSKKINTETLPIIIENRNVRRVLGGFVGGMYGRNIQQKRSFLDDNHLQFWNKLIEIGNDPYIYSSWRMPSLVFKDVVVSGV